MRLMMTLALACGLPVLAAAHSLWIEPADGGYKAFYGEAAAGEIESGAKLERFKNLVATDASGVTLGASLHRDHLSIASKSKTLAVVNMDGILSAPEGRPGTKYVQYARFVIAGKKLGSEEHFLDIIPVEGDPKTFELRKDGQALSGAFVELHSPSGWVRSHKSGADGRFSIATPWKGRYVISAYFSEMKAWEQGGRHFETLGHMASTCFIVDKTRK